MPSAAVDKQHGRQGGRWLPVGYQPVDIDHAERCDQCGRPILTEPGPRHRTCALVDAELFPDT